jgi:hypothetical protein
VNSLREVGAAVIAFAVLAWPGVALAQSGEVPQAGDNLAYDAPRECADRAAFADVVRARSSTPIPPRYAVRVTITRGKKTFRGKLVAKDEHGEAFVRDVEGRTCAEIVDALALALAMAIEVEEDAPEDGAKPPPPSPPSEPLIPPPSPSPEERRTPLRPLTVSVGASGLAVGGYTPVIAAGGAVFGELAEHGLSARLSATFAQSNPVTRGAGGFQTRASFLWGAGVVDLCAAFVQGTRLSAWGCGRFEAGALQSSSSITGETLDSHAWLAVGVSARGRYVVSGPFFLELSPWASAPLVAEHYIFRTVTQVHDVPVVVGGASLSAGFSFTR